MDYEERRARNLKRIQEFRLIDDTFMTVVFKDKACTELLIRCLLGREDLRVLEVLTQHDLKNLWGRSVRLDIVAVDGSGALYNIEVQRADSGASRKRARYNSSLLDANVTEPGETYEALTETYVIFITENDAFGKRLPLYHIERVIQETGELFADEEHILYVNGQYRGDDPIGLLMHDFFCKDPKDMNNPVLAQSVRYYKTDEEGVESMCRISEEIWKEGETSGIAKGFAKGMAEGRAEGKAEGRAEGRAEAVRALMESLGLSFIQACNSLKIPQDDRAAIEKLLHRS